MSSPLENLEPRLLWQHFDTIRQTPRPSKHEEKIVAVVKGWAEDRGFEVAQDSAGTLRDRLVTVTGFTMKDGNHLALGRVVIICCAADAQLARIDLDGPAAAAVDGLPDGTWLRVEGKVPVVQTDSTSRTSPTASSL